MVRNKLAAAIAAIGALQAGVVGALGMGDLTLNSALNQPLDAEIRLLNTEDLDRSQVLIKMATPDDFDNAGVSLDYSLSNVKFNVQLDGNGGGVIRVTTRDPIIEPYLNFLVETRWPTGRMLREYTVLLDLPVFSESSAKPIAQAASENTAAVRSAVTTSAQSPAPVRSVTSRAAAVDNNASSRASATAPSSSDGEYRVRNNDTLWEIANSNRPASASVQQTMVGIQKLNPRAFANGNINRLKAGSVLRLPSSEDISVSAKQAVSEVANQNRAWRQGDETVAETTGAQLDATDSYEPAAGEAGSEPRLSIAAGGSDDRSSAGDGSGTTSGTEALQDDLIVAQENLDKTVRENDELQSRLDDMESKVATLQRLLELKDDQLAVMQSNASDGDSILSSDELGGESDADSAEGVGSPMDIESPADQEASVSDIADAAAEAAKEKEQQARNTIITKPKEQSLFDKLLSNPLYAGGAGALLLGLIFLFIKRRKKTDDEELELDDSSDIGEAAEAFAGFDDENEDEAAVESLTAGLESIEEEDATADLVAELEQELAADNSVDEVVDEVVDVAAEETQEVQLETGDAIAEADIYIAYGRYQQAIDLLRSSIEQEPGRSDLQAKLLEVYIETRDKPAFQQQFGTLELLGDQQAVEQVKAMIADVDGVSDWLDGVEVSDFSDADMDADLIEGNDLDFDPVQEEQAIELELGVEDTVNLDVEEDLATSFDELSLDATQENTTLTMEDLESSDDSFDLVEDESTETAADDAFELDLDDDLDLEALDAGDLSDLEAEFGDGVELTSDSQDDEFSLELDSDLIDMDTDAASIGDAIELELETDIELDEADVEFEIDIGSDDTSDIELDQFALEIDDSSADEGFDLDLGEFELEDETSADTAGDALVAAGAIAAGSTLISEGSTDSQVDSADKEAADEDFDFLADTDEVATKLDLARAYIDMGDSEGARDILDEVKQEGSEEQKQEADALIERIE
ncbi:MAG: FimV/HubP family polar landmark protein [Oceanicoccus sp.]